MNPFFKPIKNVALVAFLAASIMMTLTACQEGRLAGCEGDIIVENEIPDLVMHLGDEPFRRDVIYDEPVVFRHTAGNRIGIIPRSPDDGNIILSNREKNEEMNQLSIVVVKPLRVGETIVEIEANDNCFDRRRFTSFKVTILEAEEENNN